MGWKFILGVVSMVIGLFLTIHYGIMTGNVINIAGSRGIASFYGIILFLFGLIAILSENLEDMAESGTEISEKNGNGKPAKKKSLLSRFLGGLRTRTIGAAVAGGAAAVGGFYAGEAARPYAKPYERGVQITREIGSGLAPGSKEFNNAARRKYTEASGEYGKLYLAKRKERNEEYLENMERSLILLQDTLGSATKDLTEKVPGLNEAQKLKEWVYVETGKIFGAKDMNKKAYADYRNHVKELTMLKLNALIRLRQLNRDIDETTGEMASKAARVEDNKEVVDYIGNLAREADDIYGFLDGAEDLTVDQILKGRGDKGYVTIRDMGQKIKDAGYPISERLPVYGAIAAGIGGAYLGSRRRTSKVITKGVDYGILKPVEKISEGVVYGAGKTLPYAGKAAGRGLKRVAKVLGRRKK
jgi:hypothetical protein